MSVAKKKNKFQPITALKRSVTFDGRGKLSCERCGTVETIIPPIFPDMPIAQFEWVRNFNAKIEGFLAQHRECV